MAELNTAAGHDRHRGIARSKKLSTRVDLTPMVDLGFLLITFFVFTTTLSEPGVVKLNLPAGDAPGMEVPESTALTIIPIAADKVFYYHGNLADAEKNGLYGVTNFSIDKGISEVIRKKQQALGPTRADMMLIIRPSDECRFQNVLDALDEAFLNKVLRYTIADITEEEIKFVSSKELAN
jgi:biopolymer transport protein ExbD